MRFAETADSNAFAEEVRRQDTVFQFLEDYGDRMYVFRSVKFYELYVEKTQQDLGWHLTKHEFGRRMDELGYEVKVIWDKDLQQTVRVWRPKDI